MMMTCNVNARTRYNCITMITMTLWLELAQADRQTHLEVSVVGMSLWTFLGDL